MPITALPSLDRTSATFKTDLDSYFLSALPAFSSEANALQTDVNAKQVTASEAAVTAATQATNAAASALAASGSAVVAGAVAWASGTTYAVGDARYSPINLQTYRRKVAGAGAIDPSSDPTNWAKAVDALPVQTGNSGKFLTTNGTAESWGAMPASGITLLATGAINGVSTLNITGLALSKRMIFVVDGVTFASSDVVVLKLSVNNGSTFPGVGFSLSTNSTAPIYCFSVVHGTDASFKKRALSSASGVPTYAQETNSAINASAVNAVQIYSNSANNFIGGTYYVYGEN